MARSVATVAACRDRSGLGGKSDSQSLEARVLSPFGPSTMTACLQQSFSRREWLAGVAGIALGLPFLASAGLIETVAASRPSIVPVGTYAETDSPRFSFRGSGFVVADGNMVVTNHHVLPQGTEDADAAAMRQLMVLAPKSNGESEPRLASLVASSRDHDLAVLRFQGAPLPAMTLGDRELVAQGTSIALLGFPVGGVFGFTPVVHHGIVAAITKIALPAQGARQLNAATVARLREGPLEIYQLDATAYPGNSGGPLIDTETGHVIGVINMVLVRTTRESALTNPTGITYAIPVRRVWELLQR